MSEWKLVSTNISIDIKVYECCPEPYATLKLNFTIQRSLSASSAVITPTVGISLHSLFLWQQNYYFFPLNLINFCLLVIAILTLAIFFIPPTVGAKLIVGVLNMAVVCVFLLYFKTILPSGNVNTPLIGKPLLQEAKFHFLKHWLFLLLRSSFFLQWLAGRCYAFRFVYHIVSTMESIFKIKFATGYDSKLFKRPNWDYVRGCTKGYCH